MSFPERALSPTPKHSGSILSGLSNTDTRKKQSKKDEVFSVSHEASSCLLQALSVTGTGHSQKNRVGAGKEEDHLDGPRTRLEKQKRRKS
jgi:hypothetical protein